MRSREHPRLERNVNLPSIQRVVDSVCRVFRVDPSDLRGSSSEEVRSALSLICYDDCRTPLREIGQVIGLGVSGVHYLLKRSRVRLEESEGFRRRVALTRYLSRETED